MSATQQSDGLERRRHAPAIPDASEYLRKLFLDNDLAEGRYLVHGRQAGRFVGYSRADVRGRDGSRPRGALEIHLQNKLSEADVTYLSTSGGYNVGIVAPPGEQGHCYQVRTKAGYAPYSGPDEWLKTAPKVEGS